MSSQVRVLANGAVWLGAAALYSDAQGGLSLPGDDLQTGAQNNAHPATTAHWENVENLQLTNWYLSHNNLVFKDSAVEMNVCLICRQRSVSQINPSHWLKHKRTRRKWNCIFHRSVTWMRCSCLQWSLPYNRFLFYIGPECSAASWWPRPLFSDAGKLPPS